MAASNTVLVPLEEYLRTAYRPDCEWIEGEIRERNLGEQAHAALQIFLGYIFRAHAAEWGVRVLSEQRVQVSARRFRIPDVSVVAGDAPYEAILHQAPLLCIEILSREDRMSDIQERVEDYLAMGVRAVWVIDSLRRKAYAVGERGGLELVQETLLLGGTAAAIPVAELFAELDRIGA